MIEKEIKGKAKVRKGRGGKEKDSNRRGREGAEGNWDKSFKRTGGEEMWESSER